MEKNQLLEKVETNNKNINKPILIKRCPKGTRKNKKTGLCEKNFNETPIEKNEPNKENIIIQINEDKDGTQEHKELNKDDKDEDDEDDEDEDDEDEDDDDKDDDEDEDDEDDEDDKDDDDKDDKDDDEDDDDVEDDEESANLQDENKPNIKTSNDINLLEQMKQSIYKVSVKEEQLNIIFNNLNTQKDLKYFLNTIELLNQQKFIDDTKYIEHLYPHLDDLDLNLKIAKKLEFNEHKTEIIIETDIEKQIEELCNKDFELSPHQNFVKNFLSVNTPYNSLLLYHGLGTGKTCSAIGIAEDTREYLKYTNNFKKIIIVASPNVQANFRLQLFDERKLEYKNGLWNLNNCVGNRILQEVTNNLNSLTKEKIIKIITNIINTYYIFFGYIEFANYIIKISDISKYIKPGTILSTTRTKELIRLRLERVFNNRLIIIDEIHNIRATDNTNKLVARELDKLVDYVKNIKFVLLSATPMYNDYREIIYLINLLNKNDNRSTVDIKDVFDKDGNFLTDKEGKEIGKNLFRRKINGYISYIKGDNPLTFPYRIMPEIFTSNSLRKLNYPKIQLTGKTIDKPIEYLDIYISNISEYQEKIYNLIIDLLLKKLQEVNKTNQLDELDQFGYTYLQKPIEALNFCYPYPDLDKLKDKDYNLDIKLLVGKGGLNRIMTHEQTGNPPSRYNYRFKSEIKENIFSRENIGKYSCKIKSIIDNIMGSVGPIIIYSQFIDGGLIPIALALESCGFRRYGENNSLFAKQDTEELDINTYKFKTEAIKEHHKFKCAKYVMITGDEYLSPKKYIQKDIQACTNIENINGEEVKVILISMAGSEGLDFKYIRQIHILEPWYNLNRIEQIIGRGVRTCSHRELKLSEKNTMIFMHGTFLTKNQEACDIFIYRKAEIKAKLIGNVSRVLKESSVDCLLTESQQQLTSEILNMKININLSIGVSYLHNLGDQKFSPICDYMESCYYKCSPNFKGSNTIPESEELDMSTYEETHLITHNDKIIQMVINLFQEKPFYYKDELIKYIKLLKFYNLNQIDNALTELTENNNYIIQDKYGTTGKIINIGDMFIFQPSYINDKNDSYYNKTNPINIKPSNLQYNIIDKFTELDKSTDKETTQKKEKSVKDIKTEILNEERLNAIKDLDTQKLILDIESKYEKIINNQFIAKIKKEENIYTQLQNIYNYLYEKLDRETIKIITLEYLIEHEVNEKTFSIVSYLYSNIKLTVFEEKLIKYYNSRIYKINDLEIILTNTKNIIVKYIKNKNKWTITETEDDKDFYKNINKFFNINKINNIIGFIDSIEKLGKYEYVFKTIDIDEIKNTGARCGQSRKIEIITQINSIIKNTKYSSVLVEFRSLQLAPLCIFQEYLLRYFNYLKINQQIWFMRYEESVIFNLKKIKRQNGKIFYKD